jgi:hypothetical protein
VTIINISNLDKASVLAALYNAAVLKVGGSYKLKQKK